MLLEFAGKYVQCESAGILESAAEGSASPYAIVAGKRIGIDLSDHRRRQIDSLDLRDFDLFVCVDEKVAAYVLALGVPMEKIYNVQISNPWPVQFQVEYDETAEAIMKAVYRTIIRYFS